MKPAPFDYVRAASQAEAADLLTRHGEDARPIAGGQSLAPMLAMRLVRPSVVIDLNPAADMAGIATHPRAVMIKAMTRQRTLERHSAALALLPALAKAFPWIGHPQTRNRGTVGGSLAHADPAAELPLIACLLNAEIEVLSTSGARTLKAADLFEGAMATSLRPDELLTAVYFPVWQGGRIGTGFEEVNMRGSDYALVAAAAQISLDGNGAIDRAAIAIGAAGPTPVRLAQAEAALLGQAPTATAAAAAAALAAQALDPQNDVQASAGYRRRVAAALTRRVLTEAFEEAAR